MPANSGDKAVALVRLNITDLATDPDKHLLTDEQIQALLEHYDGSTNRASARALRIIATSEVLVSKKISTQDLSSDGPAIARELRSLAQDFDREAEAEAAESEGALHLVPFVEHGRAEAEGWRH